MFDRTCPLIRAIALLTIIVAPLGCTRWTPEREAKAEQLQRTGERLMVVKSRLWRVTELGGQPVPEDAGITVQLRPDPNNVTANNKVMGNTGVNQYTGGYKLVAPDELAFSNLVTTRRAGPPEAMAREQTFLNVMDQVRSFTLEPEDEPRFAELRDAKGKTILRAVTGN
jgi:heat shock protein HslJ